MNKARENGDIDDKWNFHTKKEHGKAETSKKQRKEKQSLGDVNEFASQT